MNIKKNIAVSASGLIFNPDTGESYTVNPMGAEIIALLKDGLAQQEVISRIIEKYNTDRAACEKDFEDFAGLLKNYQLVEEGE
jgi:uncharacterized Ntn-hydrolase superfamily protein